MEFLQAEQERIQQAQELAAERQRRNQFIAAKAEVRQQIKMHAAQTRSTLLAEIVDQQRHIAILEENLTKAWDMKAKQVLYAPVAGRVQGLAVHTVGGVVTEVQSLMLIVPKDIGFVQEQMPAEIKIHTFPFTKYGVIEAHVSSISDDAVVDEQRGLIDSMHLRMARNTIRVDGKEVRLIPGMAVTAEVKTGKWRIIEFFLAPLLRYQDESKQYTGMETLLLGDGQWREDGQVVTTGGYYRQAYTELFRNLLVKFAVGNGLLADIMPDLSYDSATDLLTTGRDIDAHVFDEMLALIALSLHDAETITKQWLALTALVEIDPSSRSVMPGGPLRHARQRLGVGAGLV
ncbi:hypothetical protein NKDENANG_02372 [Candidatus Entotheonellaceae bacterium PAL068K]